ncbi:MAG: sensor histidine kinase KdpD [Bryobacterales bacterium]|nr:sensor histidine kinase KdpD [Bryobacterales bacterium]
MDDRRPNPDDLLASAQSQAEEAQRGKLKIFFGFCAGVGKTYAMLNSARRSLREGLDVVAGIVETHGRAETEALLTGMTILPRRKLEHKGAQLTEFELDAALARKPALILVDELAHANAPGSRHAKRWQDVMELLHEGINVYTTLNVQHLDSLNDVVSRITGVTVRETVPDAVLDEANEVEVVDIPVNELIDRMREGKVYMGQQAERAMGNFFRPGNLIALRELALRRTADRVDAQMRDYRSRSGINDTWPVAERILVCVGPSPFSAGLVRSTCRLASQLNAEWIAAFVETPSFSTQPEAVRERVFATLRLARQLGGEVATLPGSHAAEALVQYARARNVSRIVVGKHKGAPWKLLLRGSLMNALIERSGGIHIDVLSGDPGETINKRDLPSPPAAAPWRDFTLAALIVAGCTVAALILRPALAATNLAMIYLLGTVLAAMRLGRGGSILAALLGVAAFDFFCVPPYLTFAVRDYEYLITFGAMLVVALVISTAVFAARRQAQTAAQREARTNALYQLTRSLTGESRQFKAASVAAETASEVFQIPVVILLPDDRGEIGFRKRTSIVLPMPSSEEGIARWVFDHRERAGKGTATLPGATALYLPLRGASRTVGVMAAVPDGDGLFAPEQYDLLEMFAGQAALAIERAQATAAANEAELRAQSEQLKNSLLSAVSHDLRTPLTSITGAATTLMVQEGKLDSQTRHELLEGIAAESARLARLVNNLLDMTRLESGAVELNRDWHPLEEIVGAALRHQEQFLRERPVEVRIPADLPLIRVDDVLLDQMFLNLIENACKYTPPNVGIEIAAHVAREHIVIEFADRGPGFSPGEEETVFEKFARGSVRTARGAGLGLTICRAIVEAHGGTIHATNRPAGGALLTIRLPLDPHAPALAQTRDESDSRTAPN